jgi:type III pantothenate kinase
MLLTADIGNSLTKIGIYDGDRLHQFISVENSGLGIEMLRSLDFDAAAFSSVVPEMSLKFSEILKSVKKLTPYQISIGSKLGFSIGYKTPSTLGVDRICGIAGAIDFLGIERDKETKNRQSFITIDSGTATTVNFLKRNKFIGGMIAPGLSTMLKSLSSNTSQLPSVTHTYFDGFIGYSTESSLASGAVASTVGLIRYAREIFLKDKEIDDFDILLTGGNAEFLSEYLSFRHHLIKDLVTRGIKAIYRNNK